MTIDKCMVEIRARAVSIIKERCEVNDNFILDYDSEYGFLSELDNFFDDMASDIENYINDNVESIEDFKWEMDEEND